MEIYINTYSWHLGSDQFAMHWMDIYDDFGQGHTHILLTYIYHISYIIYHISYIIHHISYINIYGGNIEYVTSI